MLARICRRSSCDFVDAVNVRPKLGHVLAVMIRSARDFAAARAVFANSVILPNQPPIPLCLCVSVSPWCKFPCAAEPIVSPSPHFGDGTLTVSLATPSSTRHRKSSIRTVEP